MNKTVITSCFLLLISVNISNCSASDLDEATQDFAFKIAEYLKSRGIKEIKPNFLGVTGELEGRVFPVSGEQGFIQNLQEMLNPYRIKLNGNSRYMISIEFEKSGRDSSARLSLKGTLTDISGKRSTLESTTKIKNKGEIAELLGVSYLSGPKDPDKDRGTSGDYREKVMYVSNNNRILHAGERADFGVEILVDGKSRGFHEHLDKREGLTFTTLKRGEEFTLKLYNNTSIEVAAKLKIDGVNSFHFSDSDYQLPKVNGQTRTKYNYWIIPPNSEVVVSGWYKNPRLVKGFKITPLAESAVVKAGLPIRNVGIVSTSFHAVWNDKEVKMPADEPETTSTRYVAETRTVQVTENGVAKTKTYTIRKPVKAVGFGTDIVIDGRGVRRTIGVRRGTISFRYH